MKTSPPLGQKVKGGEKVCRGTGELVLRVDDFDGRLGHQRLPEDGIDRNPCVSGPLEDRDTVKRTDTKFEIN